MRQSLDALQKQLGVGQPECDTSAQFWNTCEELQRLKAAMQRVGSFRPQKNKRRTLSQLAIWGFSGSVMGGAALLGVLGYLARTAGWSFTQNQLLLDVALGLLGGFAGGCTLGVLLPRWGVRRESSKRVH